MQSLGAVGYSILGFLIFKDWQVDLDLETSPCMCWSVATTGCFCHCWVQRALITSFIRMPIPRRGWASVEASRNPWCSLLPMSSTTSTDMPSMSITLLISMNVKWHQFFSPPHWMLPHPGLASNHWCTGSSHGPDGSPQPSGMPWPSGLSFLLHDGIHNSLAAFLHSVCGHFYLHNSPSPINWTPWSWVQHPLHFYREAPLCVSAFQRRRLPPPVPGPQLQCFSLLARLLATYQQLVIHSMHGKVWVGHLSPPQESFCCGCNNVSDHLG